MKVDGKLLISLGFKGGKWFKQAMDYFEQNPTEDLEIIKNYCQALIPDEILMRDKPLEYFVNVVASNDDEAFNIAQSLQAMDRMMRHPLAVSGAIMPDVCPTGEWSMPVGSVIGIKNAIVPSMHSADVCCSVQATVFEDELINCKTVLELAHKVTHFGYGSNPLFEGNLPYDLAKKIENNFFTKDFISHAQKALGTQGDGNHFLYVGRGEKTKNVMLVTHHGSRSFGAKVYKKAKDVALRQVKDVFKGHENLAWLDYSTDLGKEYWEALQIVREWTKLNHDVIHKAVVKLLGVSLEDTHTFWNEHNFVFKKDDVFYHAKGATPMTQEYMQEDNESPYRIIPLNMAEPILIVAGAGVEKGLGFAPHGAGRNLGRSEFERRGNTVKTLQNEIKGLDVRFFSGTPDVSEYPSAYKNAKEVQSQIEDFNLALIVEKVMPYGCIMAGKQEEPWKNKK